jgi:hypothetical protein
MAGHGEKHHRRGGRKNRKHGRQKRHPAAMRYTASRRLRKRKIRNLVRHNGLSLEAATALWDG